MEPTINHQTQLFNPVCVVVLKLGYIIQEIFLRLTSIVNYWYSNTKFKSYHIILLAAHLQVLKLLQHFFKCYLESDNFYGDCIHMYNFIIINIVSIVKIKI